MVNRQFQYWILIEILSKLVLNSEVSLNNLGHHSTDRFSKQCKIDKNNFFTYFHDTWVVVTCLFVFVCLVCDDGVSWLLCLHHDDLLHHLLLVQDVVQCCGTEERLEAGGGGRWGWSRDMFLSDHRRPECRSRNCSRCTSPSRELSHPDYSSWRWWWTIWNRNIKKGKGKISLPLKLISDK